MDPIVTLISGDDRETAVLVVCYCGDLSLTFRFLRDLSFRTSTNSRIVNYFHQTDVEATTETFPDGSSMRQEIKSTISKAWSKCAKHPAIRLPDVIVHIREDRQGQICWSISHESSFQQYVDSLWSTEAVENTILKTPKDKPRWVPFNSLQFSYVLGGRGGVTIVHLITDSGSEKFVYKGLSFRLFLELNTGFKIERDTFYHELGLLFKLPDHPHIVKPPPILITTEPVQGASEQHVCGALYPFSDRQSLQEVIAAAEMKNERISPARKAKWAYQISSAMATVHSSQHFHLDLKPSNILLNEQDDVFLIDWEQLEASPFFLAPEVITELGQPDSEPRTCLDIFRAWQKHQSPALEAAELFSTGRTLWVIFEQIGAEMIDTRETPLTYPIVWTSKCDDIPRKWKEFVQQSSYRDTDSRGKFKDAAEFWRSELVL